MGSSSIHSDRHDEKKDYGAQVAVTKTAIGDEAFQQAMIKEPPPKIAAPILIFASMVAFCCSTANGYDGSLFGTLLSNKAFKKFFEVSNAGIETGIVTSMYQIGSVVAIPFVGPAIDTWGRRMGMTIGSSIIIIGVIIQLTTILNNSVDQFMAGRFFLGFGVSIAAAAGPVYVVEVSHPAHRGVITGLYNVMWPVGAIVASGAARGGLEYSGNTSWMIPVGLQLMFPCVIAFGALWLPESPRWLYTRGKKQQATENLIKLHGHGNPESEWVKLQLTEYEEHLEMDGTDKKWWDYRALFRTRASIYRLTCNCLVSLFGQWAGNNIVSYYLSAFLDTAGIKGEKPQTNVALGMNAIQIVFAAVGASITDTVGRRPMLLIVNAVCGLCWVGVTVPASIGNITDIDSEEQQAAVSPSVSKAVLAWVYIFQICYSVGWTPLQALYPVEVLSYEIRAKGMAFSSLFTSAAMLVMQFGIPVALKNIAWKTYIVFCIWCFIQSGILYLLVPETKNRTLEELDHIFSSKSPVRTSKQKKVYKVDADANVINIDDAGANNFDA
ncbi:Lactose permease [Fusarium albosuccineum]|uniref:Lactose permease n=1 Tax=Fusarium albosuccineum TaxID=1237068 RepID=A0A8H4LCX5_9HYPO|nr:Lactose permease [Fusarium albosuccineum]